MRDSLRNLYRVYRVASEYLRYRVHHPTNTPVTGLNDQRKVSLANENNIEIHNASLHWDRSTRFHHASI